MHTSFVCQSSVDSAELRENDIIMFTVLFHSNKDYNTTQAEHRTKLSGRLDLLQFTDQVKFHV